MLKNVIIQEKKVTCESRWISFLCNSKIQSHWLKAGMLKRKKMLMPSRYLSKKSRHDYIMKELK